MLVLSRRQVLAGAAGAVLAPPARLAYAEAPRPALRELAADKGILYGSCVAAPQVLSPDDFTQLVLRECACVVPENEMKWAEMSDAADEERYALGDGMIGFAREHGLAFRAHALLWYWRTPGWFQRLPDRASAEAAMFRRINDMAGRYRGRVYSWDVVNEPLNPADGRPDDLREAVFLRQIGPEYLDLAHHAAREADPRARLVVNEYDIEYDTPEHDAKRAAVLRLLERMRAAGTPVDALGIQGHLSVGRYPFSEKKLRRFLADVAAMNLAIHITEVDVTDEFAPADVVQRDRLVAEEYARFLAVVLDETAVRVLVTWGLADRHSWIVRHETNDMKWRKDDLPSRPLPFDAALAPKPSWTAIARALANAPQRHLG
jgi:endo-1,4-beta-xylanase